MSAIIWLAGLIVSIYILAYVFGDIVAHAVPALLGVVLGIAGLWAITVVLRGAVVHAPHVSPGMYLVLSGLAGFVVSAFVIGRQVAAIWPLLRGK